MQKFKAKNFLSSANPPEIQKLHGGAPTISFDLLKYNRHGKKQSRRLTISENGVTNCDKSTAKWHVKGDDVFAVAKDPNNPTLLRLTFMENYEFEAQSPEQVVQIIEAFESLGIPRQRFQDLVKEETADASVHPTTETIAYVDKDTVSGTGGGSVGGSGGGGALPQAVAQSDVAPLSIQDFDLLKVIGQGSFGKVLQVRKKDTGQIYAMKILRKAELIKRNQIEHTKAEREILGTLRHPFMVRLHYSFQTDSKLYMVMDFVNGGELYFHLQQSKVFTLEQARFYMAQVVMTLEYLHAQSTVYRDLKPENILLGQDGYIVLTDFGLSKIGITSVGGSGAGQATATFCGTPEYLAPEILTGTVHGMAVDWWSVGIMLYEMLVGSSPFFSQNRKELYDNVLKGKLSFPKGVDPDAESLIRALLHPDPTKRAGSGPTGAAEIKGHKFFSSIDWKKLHNRELTPPFLPKVKGGKTDTSNIHPAYTQMRAVDSVGNQDEALAAMSSQADFTGFEFNSDK